MAKIGHELTLLIPTQVKLRLLNSAVFSHDMSTLEAARIVPDSKSAVDSASFNTIFNFFPFLFLRIFASNEITRSVFSAFFSPKKALTQIVHCWRDLWPEFSRKNMLSLLGSQYTLFRLDLPKEYCYLFFGFLVLFPLKFGSSRPVR
jgi:hypothetical protein